MLTYQRVSLWISPIGVFLNPWVDLTLRTHDQPTGVLNTETFAKWGLQIPWDFTRWGQHRDFSWKLRELTESMAISGTDLLEVPAIYKAYFWGLCKGIPQNMALYGTVPPFQDPGIPIDRMWFNRIYHDLAWFNHLKYFYSDHEQSEITAKRNMGS